MAVLTDGSVYVWSSTRGTNQPPAFVRDVVAVAAGDDMKLALRKDGTVVVWDDVLHTTVAETLSNVVAISSIPGRGTMISSLKTCRNTLRRGGISTPSRVSITGTNRRGASQQKKCSDRKRDARKRGTGFETDAS
jgi:hypothetical protein